MSITNIIGGITIECFDEGLDDVKNPAKVTIRDKTGKLLPRYMLKKDKLRELTEKCTLPSSST
jgi:hypothetical protein